MRDPSSPQIHRLSIFNNRHCIFNNRHLTLEELTIKGKGRRKALRGWRVPSGAPSSPRTLRVMDYIKLNQVLSE